MRSATALPLVDSATLGGLLAPLVYIHTCASMLQTLPLLSLFVAGLVVLYLGAEGTLRGAVSIAVQMGISRLVIGLTLVAFGTSCPELSLDITAAVRGTTDLAFGDLIGSNIANVGLILGTAAIVRPLRVQIRLLRAEVPIAIAASLVVLAVALDGTISRQDGLFMSALFVLFIGYSYRAAAQESARIREELKGAAEPQLSYGRGALYVVIGLVALVVGAQLMIYSAVRIAELLGVSTLIIGLTVVAIGTSLPELATSIVAAQRNEADIIVGNVIGSNIFNLLLIMALVAVICPVPVHAGSLRVELPVMIIYVAALVPIMLRGRVITRAEGAVLAAGYAAFLLWQVAMMALT